VPERSEGGVVDQVPKRFFNMNLIYHPDSLSLVFPSYSRRGVPTRISI